MESLLTVESSTEATVKPLQETRYSARVVIAVNRTGRKNKKCHEMYPQLPDSAVTAAKELQTFFESLKMFVYYRENVDETAINELVSEVIKQSHSFGDHEKILFYYIGHGEKGELLPHCTCDECRLPGIKYDRESDGQTQKIDLLIRRFHNDTTKHLRKIPMLFFFDCCQGDRCNEGMMVSMGPDAGVQAEEITKYVNRIPDAGNILVAHSTLPMLKANCHKVHGPIWTRVLLKNLKIDQSISDALHATQREVSKIVCGTNEIPVVQPSMFYSTLYCEPINFYAMMSCAPSHKADSETAVSTRELDSGIPEESYSERQDGDDASGSEPSQMPVSHPKSGDPFSLQASEFGLGNSTLLYRVPENPSQELKALQKDIEEKIKEISRLKEEITQLTQKAQETDEKYKNVISEKEQEINNLKANYEDKLSHKEDELEMIRSETQTSNRETEEKLKKVQEELNTVKKNYDEALENQKTDNEIAMLQLKVSHGEEKEKLLMQINSLQSKVHAKEEELADEKVKVAKLETSIAKDEVLKLNLIIQEKFASSSGSPDASSTTNSGTLSKDMAALTLTHGREGPGDSSTDQADSPVQ